MAAVIVPTIPIKIIIFEEKIIIFQFYFLESDETYFHVLPSHFSFQRTCTLLKLGCTHL